ncbi:hypothetical protein Tco_1515072 [Tanacetum coccineum]
MSENEVEPLCNSQCLRSKMRPLYNSQCLRHSKNIPIVGVPSKNTRAVIQEYVPIMGVPSKNTRAVIQEYVPIMGVPSKNTRAVLQEYVPIMGVPSKNTRAVVLTMGVADVGTMMMIGSAVGGGNRWAVVSVEERSKVGDE